MPQEIDKYSLTKKEMANYSKNRIRMVLTFGIHYDEDQNCYRCDCGKLDCNSAGKHPIGTLFPHGMKDATYDIDFLYEGLEKYPNANLAILIEGFTVIDIDDMSQLEWLNQFEIPQTLCIETGRGRHYYFSNVLEFKPRKIPKVEIKTNGLITVPPSQHISGKYYRKLP